MDKFIKLKAVAILVCSGIAGSAMADTTPVTPTNTDTQKGTMASQVVAPNDAKLSSDVNSALSNYSGKVNVSVKNAEVFLAGELPSNTDYDNVVTLTESTKGVSDVNVDKLTVKGSTQPLQDSYLTAKVKGALIREDLMGKDIPSWSIHVETKNGVVFLSGNVLSPEQKLNILRVVKLVKGVSNVNDKTELATSDTTNTTTTVNTDGTGGNAPAPSDTTVPVASDPGAVDAGDDSTNDNADADSSDKSDDSSDDDSQSND